MEKKDEERIIAMMGDVPELEQLYAEHTQLEKQLETLNHKHHLTPEEEVERKRLQKVKLAGKDRMMQILAARSSAEATSG